MTHNTDRPIGGTDSVAAARGDAPHDGDPAFRDGSFEDVGDHAARGDLLERGWVQIASESLDELARIRGLAADLAASELGVEPPADGGGFLDRIAEHVDVDRLNALRLAVFRGLNARPGLRPAVYRQARRLLHELVGNELAMQRRVNLSIQLPGDDSSLLPLHADSWSGDSPYEIVLWIPLVDCRATKSMFVLPRAEQERLLAEHPMSTWRSVGDLDARVRGSAEYLDVRFGEVVLFDQNLLHGNRVNEEPTTRWSLNCRFKGLFTPYADKKLGEFFEPIVVRPMSQLGMRHRFPSAEPPR
ncbi:MAG: sporadic carbohydrate cluster 2OG-Fe(II) oxygenase [Acidobacteriota bacterium]